MSQFADLCGKGALGPTLGSVGVAVIVSSSRTARCVVAPHGSVNPVTKFEVASSQNYLTSGMRLTAGLVQRGKRAGAG